MKSLPEIVKDNNSAARKEIKTQYRFIHFEKSGYNLWSCHNNESCDELGTVEWYPEWKQFAFAANDGSCVFSWDCLSDIADFIKQCNQEKAKAK